MPFIRSHAPVALDPRDSDAPPQGRRKSFSADEAACVRAVLDELGVLRIEALKRVRAAGGAPALAEAMAGDRLLLRRMRARLGGQVDVIGYAPLVSMMLARM